MSIKIGKKPEVNMTTGNIAKLIIAFTVPLILGNLFQQFYNMVDTWVVGNYVGDDAFAAVGTVAAVLNMYIYAFTGFATGAGVVISQYFGANDFKRVRETVHTMVTISIIFCVVFTIVGVSTVPAVINMLKSPEGVAGEQKIYLTIIFAFISFQIIYNMSAAILRAIGDSTRPFIFLVVACVLNIILDLLFVIVFHMGVAGVAWATIIAQGVSATLCLIVLFRTDSVVKLNLKELQIEKTCARQIFAMGIPTALQQCVTAFSNIFVQSYTNSFGRDVMGGWTVYSKVDQIVMLPQQSFGMAVATFIGQNLGAGDEKRAKKGLTTGIWLSWIFSAVLVAAVMIFAEPVSYFFNKSPNIIEYGVFFLRLITPFMMVGSLAMLLVSGLRGAGNSTVPMIITLFSYVAFRQLYLFAVTKIWPGQLLPVGLAYPAGWVLCMIIIGIYYLKVGFGVRVSIVDKPSEEK